MNKKRKDRKNLEHLLKMAYLFPSQGEIIEALTSLYVHDDMLKYQPDFFESEKEYRNKRGRYHNSRLLKYNEILLRRKYCEIYGVPRP